MRYIITYKLYLAFLLSCFCLQNALAQEALPIEWKALNGLEYNSSTSVLETEGTAAINQWHVASSNNYLPGKEDGYISFVIEDLIKNGHIGFSNNPYDRLQSTTAYGVRLTLSGTTYVYENGLSTGTGPNVSVGDTIVIKKTGAVISYLLNGTVFKSSAFTSNLDMWPIVHYYGQGHKLKNLITNLPLDCRPVFWEESQHVGVDNSGHVLTPDVSVDAQHPAGVVSEKSNALGIRGEFLVPSNQFMNDAFAVGLLNSVSLETLSDIDYGFYGKGDQTIDVIRNGVVQVSYSIANNQNLRIVSSATAVNFYLDQQLLYSAPAGAGKYRTGALFFSSTAMASANQIKTSFPLHIPDWEVQQKISFNEVSNKLHKSDTTLAWDAYAISPGVAPANREFYLEAFVTDDRYKLFGIAEYGNTVSSYQDFLYCFFMPNGGSIVSIYKEGAPLKTVSVSGGASMMGHRLSMFVDGDVALFYLDDVIVLRDNTYNLTDPLHVGVMLYEEDSRWNGIQYQMRSNPKGMEALSWESTGTLKRSVSKALYKESGAQDGWSTAASGQYFSGTDINEVRFERIAGPGSKVVGVGSNRLANIPAGINYRFEIDGNMLRAYNGSTELYTNSSFSEQDVLSLEHSDGQMHYIVNGAYVGSVAAVFVTDIMEPIVQLYSGGASIGAVSTNILQSVGTINYALNTFVWEETNGLEDGLNKVIVENFNDAGETISHTISYLDGLGKEIQSQTQLYDIAMAAGEFPTDAVMISQTNYDAYGRPIEQSLPALGDEELLEYKDNFFDASSGNSGSLKHYYSNQNLYPAANGIAETEYPYTQTTYYNDLSGRVKTQRQAGDVFNELDNEKEHSFYYGRSHGELQYPYGNWKSYLLDKSIDMDDSFTDPIHDLDMHFNKTITRFDTENEKISYTDVNGNLIASCMSGLPMDGCSVQEIEITGQSKVDIHLPKASLLSLEITPIELGGHMEPYAIDRATGEEIALSLPASVMYLNNISGDQALHLTIYNAETIRYDLDYTQWTLNYYDHNGNLTRSAPPEAVNCNYSPHINTEINNLSEIPDPTGDFFTASNDLLYSIPLSIGPEDYWTVDIDINDLYTQLPQISDYNGGGNGNGNEFPSTTSGGSDVLLPAMLSIDTETGTTITEQSPVGIPGHTREMPDFVNPDVLPYGLDVTLDYLVEIEMPFHVYGVVAGESEEVLIKTLNVSRSKLFSFFNQSALDAYNALDDEEDISIDDIISFNTGSSTSEFSRWCEARGIACPNHAVQTRMNGSNTYYDYNYKIRLEPHELNGYESIHLRADAMSVNVLDIDTDTEVTYIEADRIITLDLEGKAEKREVKEVVNLDFSDNYKYDEKGRLIKQSTPDEGITKMVYNRLGQLRFSQDEEQKENNQLSYFAYDKAGRVLETGVFQNGSFVDEFGIPFTYEFHTSDETPSSSINFKSIQVVAKGHKNPFPASSCKNRNFTVYDVPTEDIPAGNDEYIQRWTGGNVSKTYNEDAASWYSYNELGQLIWMLQEIKGINTHIDDGFGNDIIGKVFRLDYQYDDLGRPIRVAYQQGVTDEALYYHYRYNANGGLASVWSSQNDIEGSAVDEEGILHASYSYFPDGSLKRKEIAEDLQGLDYLYTISGLLKSVNTSELGPDAISGFHDDVFGFTLDYYEDDYKSQDYPNVVSEITESDDSRYNGLIASQRWKHKAIVGGDLSVYNNEELKYNYTYNKLGFLTDAALSHKATASWLSSERYKLSSLAYDKNGNITALKRNGSAGDFMDDLTYRYHRDADNRLLNNQLLQVHDAIGNTEIATNDYEYQASSALEQQYTFNKIGQMTKDISVGDDGMLTEYNYLGLVKATRKILPGGTDKLVTTFLYNESGKRLSKTTYDENELAIYSQWYVYDASGQTIAIYKENHNEASTALEEMSIFGLQRLGTAKAVNGNLTFAYELKDHLGNVRSVISKDESNGLVVNYLQDYYPFGMEMEGRSLMAGTYRYGYQGEYAEKDPESDFNSFDLRQYDARLGRWMKTDSYYQYHSPYMAMGNNPVSTTDPTGGWGDDGWDWNLMYQDADFQSYLTSGGNLRDHHSNLHDAFMAYSNSSSPISDLPGYLDENGEYVPALDEQMINQVDLVAGDPKNQHKIMAAISATLIKPKLSGLIDFGSGFWSSEEMGLPVYNRKYERGQSPLSEYTSRSNDVVIPTLMGELFTGNGPENSVFYDGHPLVEDLKKSWVVARARQIFIEEQRLIMERRDIKFGIVGLISAENFMDQFVGGVRVTITPITGGHLFQVDDTKDKSSFFLHLPFDALDRVEGKETPFGTTYQRYLWFEPKTK